MPPSEASSPSPQQPTGVRQRRLLLVAVFAVATSGLVYELITATMATYLLGDSVTQFSLVIGVYLSAMGLGSWLSKSVEKRLYDRFVEIQLAIAVVGGSSAATLFLAFSAFSSIRPLLFGILVIVGTLVGLEIPLLTRLLQGISGGQSLKDLIARVLAFDYIGALAASLLFPLVLLPHLGLIRTSLFFGLINAVVALWSLHNFRRDVVAFRRLQIQTWVIIAALAAGFSFGHKVERFAEDQLFDAPVVISHKTPYQRLTVTRWKQDLRLYIGGNLQFSSVDEYRYHEALVHPVFAQVPHAKRVLVLGGGDGLAVREILKYPHVESIDLVDLDPGMTELFTNHSVLSELNHNALSDKRVAVHNADAMTWLEERLHSQGIPFDVVIVDLPDPNNFSLGKLYSQSFYRLLRRHIAENGAGVIQSTSPYLASRSFWCIHKTLEAANLHPRPYHVNVPSFGEWGYMLIGPRSQPEPQALSPALVGVLRFLNDPTLRSLFAFPADMPKADVEVNRLNDQLLVRYYEQDLAEPLPGEKPT